MRYEFDMLSRFSNNASHFCGGISRIEMTGVLDKATGESVESFESLFNFEEGIFSIVDFKQAYDNYLVFFSASTTHVSFSLEPVYFFDISFNTMEPYTPDFAPIFGSSLDFLTISESFFKYKLPDVITILPDDEYEILI